MAQRAVGRFLSTGTSREGRERHSAGALVPERAQMKQPCPLRRPQESYIRCHSLIENVGASTEELLAATAVMVRYTIDWHTEQKGLRNIL